MANIGDLGVPKPAEVDSFGWFGATIRVHPHLTDLALMDFMEEASDMDENDPRVVGFIKRQARLVIDPEDFDAFWQGALDNGQSSIDLLTVMKTIVESQAQRPTRLPGASSPGQPRTVTTSPVDSYSPATGDSPLAAMDRDVHQETLDETRAKLLQFRDEARPWLTPADRKAIEAKAGRPDIAEAIDQASRQRWEEKTRATG